MTSAPERLVLDTNVLLSGVLFGGKPGELIEAARRGRVRAVVSTYILREFRDVLATPRFGFAPAVCEELAAELEGFLEVAPVADSRARWTGDPGDDAVVETALQAGAPMIVTGDRLLLQASVPGVETVTVAEMVGRLRWA